MPDDAASPIPIVFDTSVLHPVRPSDPPAELRLLQRLAAAGHVRLLMPEMAAREWLSQLTAPAASAVDRLGKAVADLIRQESIKDQDAWARTGIAEALTRDVLDGLAQLPRAWYEAKLHELGIAGIPLQDDDWRRVLDLYFGGRPPFGGPKSRKDIPDALVFTGALRTLGDDPRTVFVSADARLRRAFENEGGAVAASLPDLLRMDAIAALHSDPKFALWWEGHVAEVVASLRDEAVRLMELLSGNVPNAVCNQTVRHYEIPEDNHEAFVQSSDEPDEFEILWDEAESLGEGILSVPITFSAEILLDFMVFRADAFDVPDWVSVSIGDFERDHYFEADGYRVGRYEARAVLQLGPSAMDGDISLEDAEVSIQDAELEGFE